MGGQDCLIVTHEDGSSAVLQLNDFLIPDGLVVVSAADFAVVYEADKSAPKD